MNGCVVDSQDTGRLVSWQQTALRRGLGDAPDPEPPASLAADAVRLAGRVRRWHRVATVLVLALIAGLCLAIAQLEPRGGRHDVVRPTITRNWLTYGSVAIWSPDATAGYGAGPQWCVGTAPKHHGRRPTPVHCEPLPTVMTGSIGNVWTAKTPPPSKLPQPMEINETDRFLGATEHHRIVVALVPYDVAYLSLTGRYDTNNSPLVPVKAKLSALPGTAAIPFVIDASKLLPSKITVHPSTGEPYRLHCAVCVKPSSQDTTVNIG